MRLLNPKKAIGVRSRGQSWKPRNEEGFPAPGGSGADTTVIRGMPTVEKRCLAAFKLGCSVQLLINNVCVGTAKIMTPPEGRTDDVFRRVLHGVAVAEFQRRGEDLVVIRDVSIEANSKTLRYPYRYGGVEPPPELLSGLCGGFHTWDRHSMRPTIATALPSQHGRIRNISQSTHSQDHRKPHCPAERSEVSEHSNMNEIEASRICEKKATSGDREKASAPSRKEVIVRAPEVSKNSEERGTNQLGVGNEDSQGSTKLVDVNDEVTDPQCAELRVREFVSGIGDPQPRDFLSTRLNSSQQHDDVEDSGADVCDAVRRRSMDGSEAESISPVRRRPYTYRTRRRRETGGEPELYKKRRKTSTSFTDDNIKHMKCCLKLDCFGQADKAYLRAQVARLLGMRQDHRREALESMLDKDLQVYKFNGKRVCATFLELAFGFSRYLQSRVKRTPASVRIYEVRVADTDSKSMKQRDAIICYLERLAESTADRMPDCEEYHLPFFRKDDVYKDFCKEYTLLHERKDATCAGRTGPPTSSYFYAIWNRHCGNIKVRSTHRFTKCGDCERLRSALEEKRTDAKAATALREKKREHNEMVSRERREYAKNCQNAILYPDNYCSIVVDGADQSAFGLPHFRVNVKEARGHSIGVKLIGVLEHGPNKSVSLFLMTEQYETGANHVIEAVHRHLTQKSLTGRLPPTLYIQADNCQRENKNQFFFAYCESLVAWGVFCEVYVSFLPIGHTHSDIDQVFSRTSTRLRHQDAVTMEELMTELTKSYTPEPHVVHMRGIINFSGLCRQLKCSSVVTGFTENRYFRFVRRAAGSDPTDPHYSTSCLVRMCCDDEWTPMRGEDEPGFLKQVPDLCRTPPTSVKAPRNLHEINLRLRSEENRIRRDRMKSLEDLRDEVYVSGDEPSHWNLSTCLEMNGRYARNRLDAVDSDEKVTDDIPVVDLDYNLNDLVAAKTDSNEETVPFWIGRILEVVKNDSGVIVKLHLHWYEMYRGSSVYTGKYKPCNVPNSRPRRPWTNVISVNAVLHKFSSLTRSKFCQQWIVKVYGKLCTRTTFP